MRKTKLIISLVLIVGMLAAGTGAATATHDNPNWGEDAGDNDCSIGHINPHDDGETRASADDCGTENRNENAD